MEPQFECRFTQDWYYTKRLYACTRKRRWPLTVFWSCFTIFLLGMAVIQLLSSSAFLFGILYLLLAVYSAWRGFGGYLRLRRSWKKTCARTGTDSLETVVTFGDCVRIRSDEIQNLEIDWPTFEKWKAYDAGEYIHFSLHRKGKQQGGSLYVPRAGFADGTGEEFLAWLEKEHPAFFE